MDATKITSDHTSVKAPTQPDPQCSHLLCLHFPATGLLDLGKLPYTEQPADIGYREEPRLGSYHLTSSSLDYFTRFTTKLTDSVPEVPQNENDISVSIARLAQAPGTSTLSAVSFFGDDDILTRFRLGTIWFTRQGKIEERVQEFELGSTEWQLHLSFADSNADCTWMILMNDLMTGATDRAVLHCRQKLNKNVPTYSQEEQKWWPVWDTMSFQTPNQLLGNNIEYKYAEAAMGAAYSSLYDVNRFDDDEVIHGHLQCGHNITFGMGMLKGLSREECVDARCEVEGCQKRILSKHDRQLLALEVDKRLRADWAVDQIHWERVDESLHGQSKPVQVFSEELYISLKLALDSMQMPESVSPPSLDLTQCEETTIVMAHLKKVLGSGVIDMSPEGIFDELGKQAATSVTSASALKDMHSLNLLQLPGYEEFLQKWLTRAVNHAIGPMDKDKSTDGNKEFTGLIEDFQKVGLNGEVDKQETDN